MEVVFNNVSYSYNKGLFNEKVALKDINLDLRSNSIHGIIGPIGSGKSTLLELMNGITRPDCGTISIGNYDLNKRNFKFNDFRYDVGLVFQFPEKQFFCKTVAEEVAFSKKILDKKDKSIKAKVVKVLKMVGLDESYLKRSPFNLDGGEKRRVAIASVLISNPKLLILDEPTIGLDNKSKKRLVRLLKTLKEKYLKTIIIVTHDVDMLYDIVDNVIVLNDGHVVKTGNKINVFSDVELLDKNNTPVPNIIRVEKLIYDKLKVDLGYCKNINDLVKKIANLKEGDNYE